MPNCVQSIIGSAPSTPPISICSFFDLFGKRMKCFLSFRLSHLDRPRRTLPSKSKNPVSAAFAQHMQTTIARANTRMLNAQQRHKHYYDKRHVPSVFDVGAEVLLATTNLHMRTTGTRKLIPGWVGPFKVLARMGGTAYRLDLPDCIHQVHNVFHVSPLKAIQKCWWHTTTTTS